MVSYVSNFIQSLKLQKMNKALAEVLLKSKEDCDNFYIGFLGRNPYTVDDFLDYREHKLSISDMTLDKFIDMCDTKASREVFESTFLQHINLSSIELIDRAISEGRASLEGIYNNFIANPNENILKYVL